MKLVAITMRVDVSQPHAERRDALDQRWHRFLAACDLAALPVPNQPDLAAGYLDHAAGLIFSGGNNIARFGGDAPERDATEAVLLQMAIAQRIPVIGVCRGMQFLADYFGCDLARMAGHAGTRHLVRELQGQQSAVVNSYHNYCVTAARGAISPLMVAPDGSVEVFRHESLPIYGMMWHPEREAAPRTEDIELFCNWFGTKP